VSPASTTGRLRSRWLLPTLVVIGVAYSVGAASTTPFTTAADVMTAIPIVALGVGAVWRWPARPRRGSLVPAGFRPYRAWIVWLAAIVVWELVDYAARGSRAAHPTLSSMADAVDRTSVLKAALFFGWLCLCAAIVELGARARAPRAGGTGAAPERAP
jgi:hypothetical protein